MSAQSFDDDIIEVKLSKGSIAALSKAMGGGGKGGGLLGMKGGGKMGGLAGIAGKGLSILGGIGIAIGAILGSVKALTGSSPMLKQMFKLMNFGIMMIFRPIGDFIGFLLRPILVMLLRNFIIPWYTDVMPIMRTLGMVFGGSLAKDLVGFFQNPTQVIADGIAGLFGGITTTINSMLDGTYDWDALSEKLWTAVKATIASIPLVVFVKFIMQIIEKMDLSKLAGSFVETGNNIKKAIKDWFITGMDNLKGGLGFIWEAIKAKWETTIQNVKWELSFIWNDIQTKWDTAIQNVKWELSFIWNDIVKKWNNAINGLTWEFKFIWDGIVTWFEEGLASIDIDWDKIWKTIMDWLNPFSDNSSSSQEQSFDSGNGYRENLRVPSSFGNKESSSEGIVPYGQSGQDTGVTLNISVGNIASEGDMQNFETRVLEVLENANSRRGRV